jgi:hypothetical protein
MSPIIAIGTGLAALLPGAMSQAPGFVIIAHNAISLARRDGVASAISFVWSTMHHLMRTSQQTAPLQAPVLAGLLSGLWMCTSRFFT